jgi:pimeloyl-ACP methyl ester carboxylesterase
MKLPALLLALGLALRLPAAETPRLEASADQLGINFDRYTVADSFGRTITFYLSPPPRTEGTGKQPIALLVLGSGCQSIFKQQGDRIGGGYQNPLREEARGRARVLIVEKPGVKFLDTATRPGGAEGASEEFLREHTLERWGEANIAALRAAWTLPGVASTRTLLIGHSEGGITVAWVAAKLPQVTHVASLAGNGPTQLFDFVDQRGQSRPNDQPGDAARRVEAVYAEWAKIQRDPESITQFWLGHPYRRWSTFLKHSATELLLQTKARVFLAQGAADPSVSVKAYDVLEAELRARGRDVTAAKIEGADHGFNTPEMPKGRPDGMRTMFGRVLAWFETAEKRG